ncbi:radical SAM protein [archaeon]|nr:radical SAM protein [archaeon]
MHIKQFLENKINKINVNHFDYDHMVYIRLFEGCNLACEHCYIPPNPKKIDSSFYENKGITNVLVEEASVTKGSKLYIQWHGGEPTMLGPDYLENAIKNVEADDRFIYQHGIQTNLINFSENKEKWINIYKNYFNSNVGISWDFKIRHIKRKEQTEETNNIFEEKFWSNVSLAQDSGLSLYMVITVTKLFFGNYKNPFDFFDFIVEKKIKNLNFERITNTGSARATWDRLGLSNLDYSEYMSKFFKAYILYKDNNPEVELNISPFDGLLDSVLGLLTNNKTINNDKEQANVWDILSYKNQGYGCWSGQCDTKFHTIDANGYKHGCTALTSEQDNKNKDLNKILNGKKIVWLGSSAEQQKNNILKTRAERQDSCQTCEFLSICSSGCLAVEKWDESGECSGAKTLFTTIKKISVATIKG